MENRENFYNERGVTNMGNRSKFYSKHVTAHHSAPTPCSTSPLPEITAGACRRDGPISAEEERRDRCDEIGGRVDDREGSVFRRVSGEPRLRELYKDRGGKVDQRSGTS